VPLTYPDTVSVGTRIHSLSEDRFVTDYVAVSHKLEKVAAEGSGIIVTFDYRAGAKAPIPDALRQKIAAMEGTGTSA
jgi:acyl-CoA thioester hydrolase